MKLSKREAEKLSAGVGGRVEGVSVAELVSRYEAGESINLLCAETRIGFAVLRRALVDAGVEIRTQKQASGYNRKVA